MQVTGVLRWQLFLCSGKGVWLLKVTFRGPHWRQNPSDPTIPIRTRLLPRPGGSCGWESRWESPICSPSQLSTWNCWILMSIRCELEAGWRKGGGHRAVVPTSQAPSGLLSWSSIMTPFPAFQPWLGPSASVLSSLETLNNSLPSFILLLWSVTLSCSSRAFFF